MIRDGEAGRPHHAMDVALLFLAVILAGFTTMVVTVPAVVPALINDRFDVAIVTAALLVSFAVAALNWARGRVSGDGAAVFRGSAFAVLAVLNGLNLLVQVLQADAAVGLALTAPGQLPVVASVLGRGVAAMLLVAAGVLALRPPAMPLRPAILLLGPATLVALALGVAASIQDRLPNIASPQLLEEIARNPAMAVTPGSAPALIVAQGIIGAGFLVAAGLAHRSYRSTGRSGQALLAAGLVIAAFSQIHGANHPGGYQAVVTTGDLLRLSFYIVLLAGIVADSRDDLRALRQANIEIRRLADAEVATAALEERARLAREIHDGLAQDLWYAKLKQTRLAQLAAFGGEARQLSDEVGDAIDNALAEARNAVAAMRQGVESGPLLEMLARHVEDYSDRFAIRAELVTDGDIPEIGPRAQAELLRIVQEAMTNARKHADATVVRVKVATDGALHLTIADNGRGFEADAVRSGFGLESMRQRAAAIGAELTVASEPQNGTRIELVVPLTERRETHGG